MLWALVSLTVLVEALALPLSWGLEPRYDTLMYAVSSFTLAAAGALAASRQPRNAIGWLFLAAGLYNALTDLAQGWGLRAAVESWPGGPAAEWLTTTSWLLSGIGIVLTFLLFPDGRLPDRRWRAVPWVSAVGVLLAVPGWSLSPDRGREFAAGRNPLTVDKLPHGLLLAAGMALFFASLTASVLCLVLRYRRAAGVERQQLKLFVAAAAVAGAALPASFALWSVTPLAGGLAAAALALLPVAACAAILRYRLYDVDVVLNRTLVYGVLTVVLLLAYGAVSVLLGGVLGRGSSWATAGATFVVAAAFRPVRAALQDAVDRRFHRARYDAVHRMAAFLEDLRSGRAAPEDVEPLLRAVTGDPTLVLLFARPDSSTCVDAHGVPVDLAAPGDRELVPVHRGDQLLGFVSHRPAGPHGSTLLREVLLAGGLAFEIARLGVELRRQVVEVEASRARILGAGDAERRRLERDLHDGAQQRLVSIGLALRHAQHELSGRAPEDARSTLEAAVGEVETTIAELRELARGLPPSQLDAGLAPAFRELARRAPVPVSVTVPAERFDAGVEAAAWFIGCEGLTNAVKHAQATRIALSAERRKETLVVRVGDDGVGGAAPGAGSGLRGLSDRVAALGGTLRIDSTTGAGTTLTAELPCGS